MRWPPVAAGLAALAACSDPPSTPAADAAMADASADASGLPMTCEGACRTTALTATFGSTTRVVDRAFYGVTVAATETTLHVEAHRGGSTACPTQSSPTPDYTLVLGRVELPTSTDATTSPGNLLDFVGDLLGGPLGAAATAVSVQATAANVCATCPTHPEGFVALDVSLTFATGNVTGHLFAIHCDSLDDRP
jgi:hypothetical protein